MEFTQDFLWSPLNIELRKRGVYNQLQQKIITGWLGIRNSAAHGSYEDYQKEQVLDLITQLSNFLVAFPA